MVKYFITFVAVLALAGCATTDHIVLTTKSVPVAVPLLYSPAPPVITRPDLAIATITKDTSDGETVKAYAATVEQLLGYSKELETALANYKGINDAYAPLRDKIIAEWKKNTGVDISIPDPTVPTTVAPTGKAVVPSVNDLVH